MTDVLEDLLHDAAAAPSHELDVRALLDRARRSRQRLVTGIAASLVAVLAVAGIAVAATGGSGDDGAQIAIGVRDGGDTPDGWTRVQLEQGTSIAVPPGWDRVSPERPILGAVGSVDSGIFGEITACGSPATTPQVSGTWVTLYEVTGADPQRGLTLPGGDTVTADMFGERPSSFGPAFESSGSGCGHRALTDTETPSGANPAADFGDALDGRSAMYLFRDEGRLFVAEVVDIHHGEASTELGDRVLDTFRVAATVTPPTVHDGTIPPTVPTTALATTLPPPTVPADASPDELAIRDVYMHLIGQVPRDAIGDYVEDYDSIADSWRAGIAQNSEDTQSRYVMRVDSVVLLDDTHADVRYTLLFDGQPRWIQSGGAVKMDGRWYITRETVCSLLTNGGIVCPPRTTPVP